MTDISDKGGHRHFQFLIEDMSGEILVRHVMEKIRKESPGISYDCKAFKGIGGFKNTAKVSEIKTDKLLNDLRIYLRGFDKSLRGIEASIFIVLDNDKRETALFQERLEGQAALAMISIDYVFCIAVEEMEAWWLGDKKAVFSAYPEARENVYKEYRQDSICGTWELLAGIVYEGGLRRMQKECTTYREIGRCKAEWADRIGKYMDLDSNLSPSFRHFISQIRIRAGITER